jgi:hypothetical protein
MVDVGPAAGQIQATGYVEHIVAHDFRFQPPRIPCAKGKRSPGQSRAFGLVWLDAIGRWSMSPIAGAWLHAPPFAPQKFCRQPVQELRMRRRPPLRPKSCGRRNQSRPKWRCQSVIHRDASRQRVAGLPSPHGHRPTASRACGGERFDGTRLIGSSGFRAAVCARWPKRVSISVTSFGGRQFFLGLGGGFICRVGGP